MRIGRFVLAIAMATIVTVPARAELLISIDKSSQTMTVTVDSHLRYVWPVSSGAPGYDTPSGQFKPFRMEADHFSKEWDDAPMPHSIFFTMQGHAIHGTSHLKAIGTPASHGCVRLELKNAAVLFDLVKQQKMANTRVVLTGETPTTRSVPVARRDRDYQQTRDRDYQPTYGSNDYDTTASIPARRPQRYGRIVRDTQGREYIVYDNAPRYTYDDAPRYTYAPESPYAEPRRESERQPFGWPFGR
jgi:hypothetical protein